MNNISNTPESSLRIIIMDDEYLVRVMKPSRDSSISDLQLSLVRNRDMLKESYLAMNESCRDEQFKRKEKSKIDYFSPTQNALVARANIDLLIPLINVNGGIAAYEGKLEGLPIEKHVTKLRQKAKNNVEEEESKTRINGFFMIGIVLLLITIILFLFNS